MDNVKKILTLKNQSETIYMKEVLENENIPHHIRSTEDSAFNKLWKSDGQTYAYIEAPEEYREKIEMLYNEVRNAQTQPIEESEVPPQAVDLKASRNLKTVLIAILALLFLFFVFKNYQQHRTILKLTYINSLFANTGNFSIENHPDKGIVTGTYEGTQIIGFIGHDTDQNAVFEKQEFYYKKGLPSKTLIDEDQNGTPEKIIIHADGSGTTYTDSNQNGILDILEPEQTPPEENSPSS